MRSSHPTQLAAAKATLDARDAMVTDWADWLVDLIPGATGVVEIPGGRLFFPDERAGELVAALEAHWACA